MQRFLLAVLFLACSSGLTMAQCGPNGCSDQLAAEQKIDFMASRNILNRHVGPSVGGFEGIGWSTQPGNIQTCTPKRPMRLTADVVRQAANGRWIRIRIWR